MHPKILTTDERLNSILTHLLIIQDNGNHQSVAQVHALQQQLDELLAPEQTHFPVELKKGEQYYPSTYPEVCAAIKTYSDSIIDLLTGVTQPMYYEMDY